MLYRPSSIIDLSTDESITQDETPITEPKYDRTSRGKTVVLQLQKKTSYVRESLRPNHYSTEIDYATNKLQFNILIMGAPRVGKSQLINALCNGKNLAETSSSLNSCTKKVECYTLEDDQQQTPGVDPFRINFYDTPGIESWTDQNGLETMLKFIEDKDPVCLIYCASPGSFADLKQLHLLLEFCKTKQIFCALVCTNMWANAHRKVVMEEFERELEFFGDRQEKLFQQEDHQPCHKVIVFGNGALCTMVNSIEYYNQDLSNIRKPVQGIDELIHSIMEQLDNEKLIGWCNAVLYRRSFWEKLTQKVNGFYIEDLPNIAFNFAERLLNWTLNKKK
jgi:GTPase Era involved in 16S rRNA processing